MRAATARERGSVRKATGGSGSGGFADLPEISWRAPHRRASAPPPTYFSEKVTFTTVVMSFSMLVTSFMP